MATAKAAYLRKAQVAADSSGSIGTPADLEQQTKFDDSYETQLEDVSQINSDGWRRKLATLKDNKANLEFLRDTTATNQNVLYTADTNRTQVWIKVFRTNSAGYYQPFMIESIKSSYTPEGAERVTVSLSGNGAPTTF